MADGQRIAQLTARLRRRGWRMTAQRAAVLTALARLGCARDAETIHAHARRIVPRLGLVTVYRALEAFAAEGVVQRVDLGDERRRYDLAEDGRSHHHHLVCLRCGRVARADRCALAAPSRLGRAQGFTVTAHRLELFGYCRRCAGGAR
jgi:Fe2+ or Zn2+ uptake regulation protein